MAERKSFLLRIDSKVLEAVQRWANDDLRSLNAQIEYVLREGLRRTGRAREGQTPTGEGQTPGPGGSDPPTPGV